VSSVGSFFSYVNDARSPEVHTFYIHIFIFIYLYLYSIIFAEVVPLIVWYNTVQPDRPHMMI